MDSRISNLRIELLRLLICAEPTILAHVQSGNGEEAVPHKIQVRKDGLVFFYYGCGPLWWQRFFNTYESVSIIDVAIRIADAITGKGGTRNEAAFDGLTKSLLTEAIKNKDLDCVIDILFDSMRHASNGALHSKYITKENLRQYNQEQGVEHKLELPEDLFAYVGIDIGCGRTVPIRVGRVKNL